MPRPGWLKVRVAGGDRYKRLRSLVRARGLHTVCEEARCPNVAECWGQGTATFLILGDVCTRACRFCAVTSGRPTGLDRSEPQRLAQAVASMELDHAVITSVTRDDLEDGGASLFAASVEAVRRLRPRTTVEVLIPDFRGSRASLAAVVSVYPDVLAHNIETVPELYDRVRPGASYRRSVDLLRRSREMAPEILRKSGIMVGLGERREQIEAVMKDLVDRAAVDILTIGQYLQPTKKHLPVERFYRPDEFRELARVGRQMGLGHVEAGPLVRSSYHAASSHRLRRALR